MDIFKLLSRSTKRTHKSSKAAPSQIPSAGKTANPQLYHDPIPESRAMKRKQADVEREELRVQENQEEQSSDEELNFFASKAEKRKLEKKTGKSRGSTSEGIQTRDYEQAPASILLDEVECRQILRSHRLKITILPSQEQKGAKRSSKKRKSKGVEVSEIMIKEEYRQIFPQPLIAFGDLATTYGISRRLAGNLVQQGYKIPTEVQMGSLPLLLRKDIALGVVTDTIGGLKEGQGVDLLVVAPTGSGKTLAFLIPVLNAIMQRRREEDGKNHSIDTIVVAPTKELASQIVNEGRKLAMGTGVKVVLMRKGMRVVQDDNAVDEEMSSENASESEEDENEVRTGKLTEKSKKIQPVTKADIIVTTPLALLHALSSGSGARLSLPSVRHLVLDEADVLLDHLFREQTVGIWDACIDPTLQVTLWSATIGSNIETLTSAIISNRRTRLSLFTNSPLIRLVVGLKDSAIPNITHRLIYAATEAGKLLALRQLLHPTAPASSDPKDSTPPSLRPPFLVFTQTIPRAIALHSELLYDIPPEAGGPSRLAVLHSDLSSPAREAIMARFRLGEVWILITTDILSRGVDFRGINAVVNYDVPNSGAAYIHRVGRTGRAGRDGGVAVTLYTKEDIVYVKNVANIIAASDKAAGREGEGVQKWLLDALPKPSKKAKQDLKKRGVEARRDGKAKISTKSGYERKLENRKKGAIQESRRRIEAEGEEGAEVGESAGEESEWGGIEE